MYDVCVQNSNLLSILLNHFFIPEVICKPKYNVRNFNLKKKLLVYDMCVQNSNLLSILLNHFFDIGSYLQTLVQYKELQLSWKSGGIQILWSKVQTFSIPLVFDFEIQLSINLVIEMLLSWKKPINPKKLMSKKFLKLNITVLCFQKKFLKAVINTQSKLILNQIISLLVYFIYRYFPCKYFCSKEFQLSWQCDGGFNQMLISQKPLKFIKTINFQVLLEDKQQKLLITNETLLQQLGIQFNNYKLTLIIFLNFYIQKKQQNYKLILNSIKQQKQKINLFAKIN
ncbi:hypothetical protein TTHERM_00648600 (macronuclear) [Tetrahymena thermophila SB210]|uniref:Uncharacterized protein n=1 Tax=Tetrahymena thermophila (strain SB210) TaxID=312017 RepID=I7M677_TETTS|nr:hypothetical protein TTHERM_00648600 [Tetrahymena thermophila SB210]EAR84597.2 hypothetical protein TTHERM_00648600 [Tetrahymena thermophila SB210]|eukprot:XP_001032260.2 hypothetical protein TTHERM_00648600 [Tetrahymena thermophila SB210]